ncbi:MULTISPECIES: rod shape-determining protein MreC [Sporomusa]|uniref:Cell shape-determining protein MreC n=1 Tax=uncultured Sporomusa sp. TaxID=307249 RepID=A0A212LT14_9FIRM|nr:MULTISPECIES: rod shape-determining protein MreC [Sporomusa]MCM0758283.1 rod shape-determining protein MreC [Sporomusa sphaeroides DSM 2875]SCM80713.1 Cell shape-determining protein MreC [uncultured Sporomusa sp.]HML31247.1 rod shape-determining protein MreC [Sporomusa sphaeroides]
MRFIHKKAVILLVAVLTVFLLAGTVAKGKYQFAFMEQTVITLLTPIEYVLGKLGFAIRHTSSFTGQIMTVYRDNQALKAENEGLRQKDVNTTEILAENARLRGMLDYKKTVPQFDFVTAQVIARDPGTWTSIIIINRGAADGIAKDMAVVTAQGLVGNVVTVYNNAAKVQLILDPRSAVGCLVQRPESRVAGIVEGSTFNSHAPRMINIARDADVIKGDKIITSGFGGIYPKGLLVGEVMDIVNDEGGLLKYAVLKPAVDFDRLEEVLIIVQSREVQLVPSAAAPTTPGQTWSSSPVQPKGAGQ